MPRILHVLDSLARTGVATQLLLLSRGLVQAGWDVHVAALARTHRRRLSLRAEFAAAGVQVCELARRWKLDPLADFGLARHVKRLAPDVVHTWDSIAGQFGAIANRRGGHPRLIAGLHRIHRRPALFDAYVERRFAPAVDRFVANSETVKAWHVARGLPAEKFSVILPGVAPSPAPGPQAAARAELLADLHLPSDARLIGVIGRLLPEKRVKDLIWAADLLRVLHDNLRMLIIGEGPQRDELVRYARQASDLDHIRFLGEREDVPRILPHLDVLWNASENTGPSMAVLEAMAAGVPVIASDTPSNRELVSENESGYLIPLGARAGRATRARHTDRLFNDGKLARQLAERGRRHTTEIFKFPSMVSRYTGLYTVENL